MRAGASRRNSVDYSRRKARIGEERRAIGASAPQRPGRCTEAFWPAGSRWRRTAPDRSAAAIAECAAPVGQGNEQHRVMTVATSRSSGGKAARHRRRGGHLASRPRASRAAVRRPMAAVPRRARSAPPLRPRRAADRRTAQLRRLPPRLPRPRSIATIGDPPVRVRAGRGPDRLLVDQPVTDARHRFDAEARAAIGLGQLAQAPITRLIASSPTTRPAQQRSIN